MWNYKYLRITPVIVQDRYYYKQMVKFELPNHGYRSGRIEYVDPLYGYTLVYGIIPDGIDGKEIWRIPHSLIVGSINYVEI